MPVGWENINRAIGWEINHIKLSLINFKLKYPKKCYTEINSLLILKDVWGAKTQGNGKMQEKHENICMKFAKYIKYKLKHINEDEWN